MLHRPGAPFEHGRRELIELRFELADSLAVTVDLRGEPLDASADLAPLGGVRSPPDRAQVVEFLLRAVASPLGAFEVVLLLGEVVGEPAVVTGDVGWSLADPAPDGVAFGAELVDRHELEPLLIRRQSLGRAAAEDASYGFDGVSLDLDGVAFLGPVVVADDEQLVAVPAASQALNRADPNLASGVVVLRDGDDAFIVGGDAPLTTWERLAPSLPKGAVVRWSHHGGSLDADPAAHARVREVLEPSHILVSVGAGNTYGHPTEAFFDAAGGEPYGFLYCTQSTASCVAGGAAAGPCAGTMRAELGSDEGLVVRPDQDDHEAHVTLLGNARCVPVDHGVAP